MRPTQILFAFGLLGGLALSGRAREGRPQAAGNGRASYLRLGCWQCHLQARDKAFPAVRGSARTGPVLGSGRPVRSLAWHRAHLYAPRSVAPESQMPAYAHLFKTHPRAARVRAFIARYDSHEGGKEQDGIVTRREYERGGGKRWDRVLAELDSGNGVVSAADAAPVPGPAAEGLANYLVQLSGRRIPASPHPPPRPELDARAAIARGQRLFLRFCSGCHGTRADGNGPAAAFFGDHPPRNFLRGDFRFKSTPTPQPPLDADLFATIRRGAGPSMPAWTAFSDAQVWDLVEFLKSNHPDYLPDELFVENAAGEEVLAFTRDSESVADASGADLEGGWIRKLAGRWWWVPLGKGAHPRPVTDGMRAGPYRFRIGKPVFDWTAFAVPEAMPVPEPPIRYSRSSAEIGAGVYAELGCASCHGSRGHGDGPAAARTRGGLGQILLPADYSRGPAFLKGGADPRSLVRLFLTGMQGTPMPAFDGSFAGLHATPENLAPWHLAHFVMRQAGIAPPR